MRCGKIQMKQWKAGRLFPHCFLKNIKPKHGHQRQGCCHKCPNWFLKNQLQQKPTQRAARQQYRQPRHGTALVKTIGEAFANDGNGAEQQINYPANPEYSSHHFSLIFKPLAQEALCLKFLFFKTRRLIQCVAKFLNRRAVIHPHPLELGHCEQHILHHF